MATAIYAKKLMLASVPDRAKDTRRKKERKSRSETEAEKERKNDGEKITISLCLSLSLFHSLCWFVSISACPSASSNEAKEEPTRKIQKRKEKKG